MMMVYVSPLDGSKQTKKQHSFETTRVINYVLEQGSATFNAKRAIFAPFLPNKVHVEPQNIWCPNKDNTAYS